MSRRRMRLVMLEFYCPPSGADPITAAAARYRHAIMLRFVAVSFPTILLQAIQGIAIPSTTAVVRRLQEIGRAHV